MLGQAGFVIESEYTALNMPLLSSCAVLAPSIAKAQRRTRSPDFLAIVFRAWLQTLHSIGLRLVPGLLANEYIFVCRKSEETKQAL